MKQRPMMEAIYNIRLFCFIDLMIYKFDEYTQKQKSPSQSYYNDRRQHTKLRD